MFDGIYIESEMIFWIGLVLLNKLDWLVHVFHIWVQCIQFNFHCFMVFSNGSGFYIFRFRWTDKREKCKESVHKMLSYKMKDEKWWQWKTLVQFR